jgi:hypothetical protein
MAPILGPVTGTGPRTFRLTARRAMGFYLSCLAYSGRPSLIWLYSDIATTNVMCEGPGLTPVDGVVFKPVRREIGTRATLRVAAPPGTTWQLRVDGSQP